MELFMAERHLATLSIPRPDGRAPHVTPVGFTWDAEAVLARVITFAGAVKVRLIEEEGTAPVTLCQIDGGRWLSLEGPAVVTAEPERCAEGLRRYAERYRPPGDRGADRRVIEVAVSRITGRA
ncbi:MAG: pyridoxamine 5'-phosphate oxidase family protein [bacterium]|nr:pyridoxamine 5'-phosphate oxidase family protein [bacterium]